MLVERKDCGKRLFQSRVFKENNGKPCKGGESASSLFRGKTHERSKLNEQETDTGVSYTDIARPDFLSFHDE